MPVELSAHSDYDERHYRFTRQRQGWLYVPLEPSPPPLEPRWKAWANALILLALFALAFPGARLCVAAIEWMGL